MKLLTTFFLLFSFLLVVLGTVQMPAQQTEDQDRQKHSREQLLLSNKDLIHHEQKLEKLLGRGGQHFTEDQREQLMNEPSYDGLNERRQTNKAALPTSLFKHHSQTSSDSATVDWIANYTSGLVPSSNYATALAVDGSGNVYVTGTSVGSTTRDDYATVKYNASGVEQWTARYNGPGNSYDYATALAVDGSGNVYVTGQSVGSGTYYDYATVKYNASGVEQWTARYNGPGNDWDVATALAVDGSGNVYVTGRSLGSATNRDYATVKYNASGVQQWAARYNGPGNNWDEATAIAIDGSGNVYVTGWSVGSATYEDYATVKYNASGLQQWVARYNGPGNSDDEASALAVDGTGNVYVTGWSYGYRFDYATVKYNASGVEQWTARYNGPGNSWDYATALAIDGSGNVYVTGESYGSATSDDYTTVKYNASGVEQWTARYNGPGNSYDEAEALAVDGSGNVYVTGRSRGSGTSDDYATVKYNASGVEQWTARYNGPGNSDDDATALAVDGSGNVYVTGYATFADGYRYTTIKYRQTIIGITTEPELPREFLLHQNYPNPFNPSTVIKWQLPVAGNVSLKVYDVLGNEAATLINEFRPAGSYQVEFDARGLASGVYFYRINIGSYTDIKKMILLR